MRYNINSKKKGFTLVELIITIFIFSAVLILATSSLSVGFMTGRLHSTASQEANRSANLFFDILGQKMANANASVLVGSDQIYGFKTIGVGADKKIAVASVGTPDNQCSYFSVFNKRLVMKQQDCGSILPTPNDNWNKISSEKIQVTNFDFSNANYNTHFVTDPINTVAPYLFVTITLEDTKNKVTESFQTAYNIPYPTYSQWGP